MVFEDIDRPEKASVKEKSVNTRADRAGDNLASKFPIATPLDHLAAFMADMILFLPLATFVLAPLRKEILLAQLAGENDRLVALITLALALLFACLVSYQTVFIAIWGMTPGKRILRLKVISIWDAQAKNLAWSAAFLRAIFWCLGAMALGLPWLSVFSNSRRRALHDRVSDTVVIVDDPRRAAGEPSPFESSVVGGMRAAGLVFVSIALLVATHGILKNQELTGVFFDDTVATAQSCEDVTSAMSGWMGGKDAKRIEVALALHAGERIEDECLDAEADSNFMQNRDIEFSYVAKALIHQEDQKLFNRYEKKICALAVDGPGCKLMTWLKAKDATEAAVVAANAPMFLKIWAIRLDVDRHQNAAALALLSEPAPHMELAYYFVSNRQKVLRDLNQTDRAQTEFQAVLDGLNRGERIDLSRESCLAETEMGCSLKLNGCDSLKHFTDASDDDKAVNIESSIAMIRAASCSQDPKAELKSLKSELVNAPAVAYIEGLQAIARGETSKAHRIFIKIAEGDETGPMALVSWAAVAEHTTSVKELRSIAAVWQQGDEEQVGWRALGWQVLRSSLRLKQPQQAFEIGLRLKEAGFEPPEVQKNLVVAAFQAGHLEDAQKFLASYLAVEPTLTTDMNERGPASIVSQESDETFARVLKTLQAAEGS